MDTTGEGTEKGGAVLPPMLPDSSSSPVGMQASEEASKPRNHEESLDLRRKELTEDEVAIPVSTSEEIEAERADAEAAEAAENHEEREDTATDVPLILLKGNVVVESETGAETEDKMTVMHGDPNDTESTPSLSDSEDILSFRSSPCSSPSRRVEGEQLKQSNLYVLEPAPGKEDGSLDDVEAGMKKLDDCPFHPGPPLPPRSSYATKKQQDNSVCFVETAPQLDSIEKAEVQKETRRWYRRRFFDLLIAFLGLVAIITLSITYGFPPKEEEEDEERKGPLPSPPPPPPTTTNSHTSKGDLLEHPMDGLLQELEANTLSNIHNPSTPQSKAWDWLSSHPNLNTMKDWRKKQLFGLSTFYHSMEGPMWPKEFKEGWLDYTRNECTWFSSAPEPCNDQGVYQSLHLTNLQLSTFNPFVPREVAFLTNLSTLALPQNDLNVPLVNLIPSAMFQMTQLSEMDLSSNSLNGPLPTAVGMMKDLKSLDVSRNQLSLAIPTELSQLSALETLSLGTNLMISTFPTQLGLLSSSLTTLTMENLPLYGYLPTQVGTMSSLQVLSLSSTGLIGPLRSEIGGLTNLKQLRLDGSFISGTIPKDIESLQLQILALNQTYLFGEIPSGICSISKLEFDCLDRLCGCDCDCQVN